MTLHPEKVAIPETALTAAAHDWVAPTPGCEAIPRVIGAVEVVTVLPPASWTVTFGWVPNTEPSTALGEGWVEKDSLLAAPMVRLNPLEETLERPDVAAVSV